MRDRGGRVESRVDLFARIRRDARVEGLGTRKLAARYSVGRNTVRRALQSAEPPTRKTPDRVAPKLGPFKALIDGMLREDLSAPRKQRHTATRIWNRLVDEHDADVGYPSVRDYVRARRSQIAAEVDALAARNDERTGERADEVGRYEEQPDHRRDLHPARPPPDRHRLERAAQQRLFARASGAAGRCRLVAGGPC